MTAKVILNPYSGRWKGQALRAETEAALQAAGVEYELVLTDAPGHGVKLAEEAVQQGYCPILAAGGDGSISEVVNGMVQAVGGDPAKLAQTPLGILPLGSANDLVDNLHLPDDIAGAVQVIKAGFTRKIDLGHIRLPEIGMDRYFHNNSAMGLEPYITLIQQRISWLKGDLRYMAATVRGVLDEPHWNVRLEWEGGQYEGPVTLVTVGNNPRTGGVFYVTPHADPFDGQLTFVYGYMPTRLQILRLLPRTMKPGEGSYVEHPDIHEVNTTWLKIHSEEPSPFHADGEIQMRDAHDIEFSVLARILPVLMPPAPVP